MNTILPSTKSDLRESRFARIRFYSLSVRAEFTLMYSTLFGIEINKFNENSTKI